MEPVIGMSLMSPSNLGLNVSQLRYHTTVPVRMTYCTVKVIVAEWVTAALLAVELAVTCTCDVPVGVTGLLPPAQAAIEPTTSNNKLANTATFPKVVRRVLSLKTTSKPANAARLSNPLNK